MTGLDSPLISGPEPDKLTRPHLINVQCTIKTCHLCLSIQKWAAVMLEGQSLSRGGHSTNTLPNLRAETAATGPRQSFDITRDDANSILLTSRQFVPDTLNVNKFQTRSTPCPAAQFHTHYDWQPNRWAAASQKFNHWLLVPLTTFLKGYIVTWWKLFYLFCEDVNNAHAHTHR